MLKLIRLVLRYLLGGFHGGRTTKYEPSPNVFDRPTADTFDALRGAEEDIYKGIRRVLGKSFLLVTELLDAYNLFLELISKPVFKSHQVAQIVAIFHLVHWLRNEAIAGVITLMRGHITDAAGYTRRAIEICASILHCHNDEDAARLWGEAAQGPEMRAKYVKEFPAFKLVKTLLPADLVDAYERYCLDVHPTLFAIAKRASISADGIHQFTYFDVSDTDGYQIFLVLEFFNLIECHARIMGVLAAALDDSAHFDLQKWQPQHMRLLRRIQEERGAWRPREEAHFAKMEAELKAEMESEIKADQEGGNKD